MFGFCSNFHEQAGRTIYFRFKILFKSTDFEPIFKDFLLAKKIDDFFTGGKKIRRFTILKLTGGDALKH